MPLIMLKVSTPVSGERKQKLLASASRILAETTGKPEAYAMVTLEQCDGLFQGKEGALAFVEVRGIGGLGKGVNTRLAAAVCGLLKSDLGIPPDRVYINFADVAATAWGWNNGLFG